MKSFLTFAMSARDSAAPLGRVADKAVESISPGVSHAVGATSALTGIALWADWAKHLTVLVGLIVALVALAGGVFYAGYWGIRMVREWRELRAGAKLGK